MRLFPIISAIVVVATLYFLVFQRDALLDFAGTDPAGAEAVSAPASAEETAGGDESARHVSVVAFRSKASSIDGAVILRGRTEAVRQVEVRAETSVSLNGRPPQPIVDPTVDLASVPTVWWGHAPWVVLLE